MQRQGSFSQAEYAGKKKQTRRDRFLGEMEQVVRKRSVKAACRRLRIEVMMGGWRRQQTECPLTA